MGIQNFTKLVSYSKEIKLKQLKGKNIVIDAYAEIYRAALGMTESACLRDSNGLPTSHINTLLLGVILKLKAAGAYQYWVLDYYNDNNQDSVFHNNLKEIELKKRNLQKKKAVEEIRNLEMKLKKTEEEELFSDDEEEKKYKCEIVSQIDKQKKRAFKLERFYIEDLIFMLNMLDIPWCMAPPGYEGEQICAAATYNENIMGILMDSVLSPDTDTIVCGARSVIKRDVRKKKFFLYEADEIFDQLSIDRADLAKIAAILGCDYTKYEENGKIITGKTKGVGPLTVLKKFRDIELTPLQQNAVDKFMHVFTQYEIDQVDVFNAENEPFTNNEKYQQLIDWIVFVKGFNKARIEKAFVISGVFQ